MSTIELTKQNAEKYEEIEAQCLQVLQEAFSQGETTDIAKQAVQFVGIIAKNRATQNAREGLRFGIAQAIAKDEVELRRYVTVTSPEIKRALLPGRK